MKADSVLTSVSGALGVIAFSLSLAALWTACSLEREVAQGARSHVTLRAEMNDLHKSLERIQEETALQNQTLSVMLQTMRLLTLSQKEAAAKGGQGL